MMHDTHNGHPETLRTLNDIIRDRLLLASAAAEKLAGLGHSIVGIDISTGCAPTIQIETCARLARLVRDGQAAYTVHRNRRGLHEQVGSWPLDGCRVIWIERGH